LRDGHRLIGAKGIKDLHVIGPSDGGQAPGKVLGFVFGQNQNSDHGFVL
jgi:hypothetical protein